MARRLNDQNVIQDNILMHIQNLYNEHSKQLQGTPIYVNYFHKNMSYSDQDRTLENVKEVIGFNSPNLYDRIENFPLYLAGELNPAYEVDDTYGLNTETDGDAVILPKMIKPYVDDFFSIIYNDDELLFRVTKVEFDRINGYKYYKITYTLSPYEKNQIEEQVKEELVTRYENIGTEDKPIIKKKNSIIIDELYDIIEKITDIYMRAFMNKKYKVLTYKYNDKNLYNEFLIRFIIDNEIFKTKFKKLYKSYIIQDIFPDSVGMMELYNDTIYMALSEGDKSYFTKENMVTLELLKDLVNNPFSLDYEDYYRVYYVDNKSHENTLVEMDKRYDMYKEDKFTALFMEDGDGVFGKNTSYLTQAYEAEKEIPLKKRHVLLIPHSKLFIENVHNNIPFDDDNEYFLENIIIKFLNKTLIIDDEFVSIMKKKNWHPAFKEFLLIPCLIFIMKKGIEELSV